MIMSAPKRVGIVVDYTLRISREARSLDRHSVFV